jgi:malonyl-CoA O-methyltransferase
MSGSNDSGFNRKAYNLWSKQYDQDVNSTITVDDAHFPQVLAEIKGWTVLEIGCGTGRHTQRLAQSGNRVVAIDPSEGMLEIARNKLASKDV